jgi:hypothetical protein
MKQKLVSNYLLSPHEAVKEIWHALLNTSFRKKIRDLNICWKVSIFTGIYGMNFLLTHPKNEEMPDNHEVKHVLYRYYREN